MVFNKSTPLGRQTELAMSAIVKHAEIERSPIVLTGKVKQLILKLQAQLMSQEQELMTIIGKEAVGMTSLDAALLTTLHQVVLKPLKSMILKAFKD